MFAAMCPVVYDISLGSNITDECVLWKSELPMKRISSEKKIVSIIGTASEGADIFVHIGCAFSGIFASPKASLVVEVFR